MAIKKVKTDEKKLKRLSKGKRTHARRVKAEARKLAGTTKV